MDALCCYFASMKRPSPDEDESITRYSLRIPTQLYLRIRLTAKRHGRSAHSQMLAALDETSDELPEEAAGGDDRV
jgi:hypothetical protein